MVEFNADIRDLKFALIDHAGIDRLQHYPGFEEIDRDTIEAILDEAYKFAKNQMGPANEIGDREGCAFDSATGVVKVPKAYHEVYKDLCENGWLALHHSPQWGGQGMPGALQMAVSELFYGACLSLTLGNLLTTGTAHLIEVFGSDALKQAYLRNMYGGKWAGTMCLTESGAGSDVGACRTRARKQDDHYLIEGEKIFITFGEHDLTENICHAVLARIEGAPEGTRGISLFAVPKIRVNGDGSLGEPNNVRCANIEEKMGIHGSPTSTLVFGDGGDCHGSLIGQENKGMTAMFQMMNDARLKVGLQGVALAGAAYQTALAYAKERVQGRSMLRREKTAVPIVHHPDVRQMLMWQKAYAEGTRALLMRTAVWEDIVHQSSDEAERREHHGLVDLVTPVCKAFSTDMGFRSIELSMQTLGGYGYLREYGIEQYMRDVKITSIYEGTNGIQALDLIGRKLPADDGAGFRTLLARINATVLQGGAHSELELAVTKLVEARDALVRTTTHLTKAGGDKPILPVLNATGYLDLLSRVVVGWLLIEQAVIAWPRLQEICGKKGVAIDEAEARVELCQDNADARFYDGKVRVAQFFAHRALAECAAKAAVLESEDTSALEVVF